MNNLFDIGDKVQCVVEPYGVNDIDRDNHWEVVRKLPLTSLPNPIYEIRNMVSMSMSIILVTSDMITLDVSFYRDRKISILLYE